LALTGASMMAPRLARLITFWTHIHARQACLFSHSRRRISQLARRRGTEPQRLLASSQAFGCATTQRTVPSPARPTVPGAVISSVGVEPGDGGADRQSAARPAGKQHRGGHIGGRWRSAGAAGRHERGGTGMNLYRSRSFVCSVPLILLLLAASACHIKLVSDYDENFVRAANATQKEITLLLQDLRNPPRDYKVGYQDNIANYNSIRADLNGMLVLASSHRDNEPTVDQVLSLIGMVNDLEKLHQSRQPSQAFLEQVQRDINTAFSIIIRTENAKKAAR
jgi:hypothetical protein